MLWRCVWRIRGRWRLCASVTASCACVSLSVWEYTWPSNQRQQEQRQPRFTIISCTFFSSLPLRLSHSIPHLFKQLITSGNFPDVLREKRLTSCRLKQLSKVQKSVTIYQLDGSTHLCLKSQETQRNIQWCIAIRHCPGESWEAGKTLWGTFESFRPTKRVFIHTMRWQNSAF